MSAVITMPAAFDESIRAVCSEAVQQAVAALAEKYSFDAEEAIRELDLGELKILRKRGPAPKKSVAKADKKTKAQDESKPKKRQTGYLLFSQEMRAEARAELEAGLGEGEKLKPQVVVSHLAGMWKALSTEEKAEWNEKAKPKEESAEESTEESEE
tara:strand:+ start:268 stop:735 length:468 start_codon:yes stop_codon:yes gene_type:complete